MYYNIAVWTWSLSCQSSYFTGLTLLVLMWDGKMPARWDGVRWMTQALWCSIRLLQLVVPHLQIWSLIGWICRCRTPTQRADWVHHVIRHLIIHGFCYLWEILEPIPHGYWRKTVFTFWWDIGRTALGDPGSSSQDDDCVHSQRVNDTDGWESQAGCRRRVRRVITRLRMLCNLKLMNYLFLEFSI